MPSNAEIRTVQFMQGVEIDLPSNVLDDNAKKVIINNASNQSTGIILRDDIHREAIIEYTIRRRTDTTAAAGDVIVERGKMRLTANPDAALLANRWLFTQTKDDEGISPGVSYSKSITDDSGVAVCDLLYSSSNLAGTNHECVMSYALTLFLV